MLPSANASHSLLTDAELRLGRCGVEEIHDHPFFNGIEWNTLLSSKVNLPIDCVQRTDEPQNRHHLNCTSLSSHMRHRLNRLPHRLRLLCPSANLRPPASLNCLSRIRCRGASLFQTCSSRLPWHHRPQRHYAIRPLSNQAGPFFANKLPPLS